MGQVFEAGQQRGEASTDLPHTLWMLRSTHARIVPTRLIGVNRRSMSALYRTDNVGEAGGVLSAGGTDLALTPELNGP